MEIRKHRACRIQHKMDLQPTQPTPTGPGEYARIICSLHTNSYQINSNILSRGSWLLTSAAFPSLPQLLGKYPLLISGQLARSRRNPDPECNNQKRNNGTADMEPECDLVAFLLSQVRSSYLGYICKA